MIYRKTLISQLRLQPGETSRSRSANDAGRRKASTAISTPNLQPPQSAGQRRPESIFNTASSERLGRKGKLTTVGCIDSVRTISYIHCAYKLGGARCVEQQPRARRPAARISIYA